MNGEMTVKVSIQSAANTILLARKLEYRKIVLGSQTGVGNCCTSKPNSLRAFAALRGRLDRVTA